MAQTAEYYVKLYGSDPELRKTRSNFAMKEDTLPSAQRRHDLTNFYFWTAWAASTERPNSNVTYTNNRSEEHTSELQSLMRISYAVFCLKKKKNHKTTKIK